MKSKKKKAVHSFKSGLNCAQSVLTAYSDDLNFDNNFALSVSSGFGGGMGKLQETCGAVTGSFMVLGIYTFNKYTDKKVGKAKADTMIQTFRDRFRSVHGHTDCKSLLNCDLKTEEGLQFATSNNLFEKICEKCVSDSITIVDELISGT